VAHAQALRVAQRGQRVGGLAALADDHDQGARVGHARAVAVFARDLDLRGDCGDVFEPVARDAAAVIARAATQDQHAVDLLEHAPRGLVRAARLRNAVEQLGHDARHALERVSERARLLENFFCM